MFHGRKCRLAGLVLLALWLDVPVAAGAAPAVGTVIERPGAATRLSAYRDAVAWSRLTTRLGRGVPRYVLMLRRDGQTRRIDVPAQHEDFDVSLGPGQGGRLTAVYRRCSGNGCEIGRYDVARRHATSLPRSAGGRLPAIWADRVAFVRNAGDGDRVVVQGLDGFGRRTLPPPTPIPESETGESAVVTGVAIRWRRLLYTATTGPSSELCPDGEKVSGSFDQLWTGRASGEARRLEARCSAEYASPQFVGTALGVTYRDASQRELTYLARRIRPNGSTFAARFAQARIESAVTAGGTSYWMETLYTGQARLRRGNLAFAPVAVHFGAAPSGGKR